uniref:Uncharacterized protein n=1 Tax=Corethron hystrix TaxID=216773 RepID=A0A6U5LTK3_9STRA|mmetsp:Transcript_6874/g.14826  ORF Transcript_6874/g.14826 Transcript_6874/m.14826 type:complete len:154 (+) Transcript_6874:600-1061(+)
MSPNNLSRIEIPRTAVWVQQVIQDVRAKYNVMMEKWIMGTDGGPGAPEDFTEWDKRDDGYLNDYCNDRWLCWVYMIDRSLGFLFSTKTREIAPNSALPEFGFGANPESLSETTPRPAKRSKRKKKEDILVSTTIMACANAMSQGMDRLASLVG